MGNSKSSYHFIIFLWCCLGAHAWFLWWIETSNILLTIVDIVMAFYTFNYTIKYKIKIKRDLTAITIMGAYACGSFLTLPFGITLFVHIICQCYILNVLISDKRGSEETLDYVTKTLAYLVAPGIVLYFGVMIFNIPSLFTIDYGLGYKNYLNYIFFVLPNTDYVKRFHSVFLEPAYFATFSAFLLYAGKFDFRKKSLIVILVGLLISLSLAGYVLLILGYIHYQFSQGLNVKKYFSTFLVLLISYFAVTNYNGGNNTINKNIFNRLQFDNKKVISGNNRTGRATEYYFYKTIVDGQIMRGLGQAKVQRINGGSSFRRGYEDNIRGAGYMVYIVTYGLLPALIYLLMYCLICFDKPIINKKYNMGFVILIILTFLQASYPSSASWFVPFILGCYTSGNPKIK